MTRKELNAIRHAAYLEWAKGEDAQRFLSTTNCTTCSVYEVREGTRVELLTLDLPTQMNTNTLESHGFSQNATVRKLFAANRQTKTLDRA